MNPTIRRLFRLAELLALNAGIVRASAIRNVEPPARITAWVDEYNDLRGTPAWVAYCEQARADADHYAHDLLELPPKASPLFKEIVAIDRARRLTHAAVIEEMGEDGWILSWHISLPQQDYLDAYRDGVIGFNAETDCWVLTPLYGAQQTSIDDHA